MDRPGSHHRERLGIAEVQLAISKLGFVFREQPTDDYGIDAHAETTQGGQVLGHLLAMQVKSGESYFREEATDGWWFRPKAKHVKYWLNHSLPVLVVLVDPDTERCYWEHVHESKLTSVGDDSWKMLIPRRQTLSTTFASQLRSIAKNDLDQVRLGGLELAKPWMRMLSAGRRLVVDVEEWVNKTSGKGQIVIGEDKEDGNDAHELARWGVFLGLRPYSEVLRDLFPWADLVNHEETYEQAQWENPGLFEQLSRHEVLHPYSEAAGEVEYWRLELLLGDLGASYLRVDEYVSGDVSSRLGPLAPK